MMEFWLGPYDVKVPLQMDCVCYKTISDNYKTLYHYWRNVSNELPITYREFIDNYAKYSERDQCYYWKTPRLFSVKYGNYNPDDDDYYWWQ